MYMILCVSFFCLINMEYLDIREKRNVLYPIFKFFYGICFFLIFFPFAAFN